MFDFLQFDIGKINPNLPVIYVKKLWKVKTVWKNMFSLPASKNDQFPVIFAKNHLSTTNLWESMFNLFIWKKNLIYALRTCSSHVFTNPEFSICDFVISREKLVLNVYWDFISYFEQIKQTANFHGKNSGFVNSGFVKTCDELVIGLWPTWTMCRIELCPSQILWGAGTSNQRQV